MFNINLAIPKSYPLNNQLYCIYSNKCLLRITVMIIFKFRPQL
jgi:hypothetical protein